MAKTIRVFVYGTLKQGYGNHSALEGSKFLGRATVTAPLKLVDLGWYPGLVRTRSEVPATIGGEVYEIDSDTLATLDLIEGHPSFYCREKLRTSLNLNAWAYLLPEGYAERIAVSTPFWKQTEEEEAWLNERNQAA